MTFDKAIQTYFNDEVKKTITVDEKNTIVFDVNTQKIVRKALLESLGSAGYLSLAMIVAGSWQIEGGV